MIRVLLNVSETIWLLLQDIVQPLFEFMSTPFNEYLNNGFLPNWVVDFLDFLVPGIMETSPIEWFFSYLIITFIVVSFTKFFLDVFK